jgi:hypothetical protein
MKSFSLFLLAWAGFACILVCVAGSRPIEKAGDVTMGEIIAVRAVMLGGGIIGLVLIAMQASKIINS